MLNSKAIVSFVGDWLKLILCFFRTRLMSDVQKDLEILALRSQLSILQREVLNGKVKKPKLNFIFRQLWVILSKNFYNWKSSLIVVKPETVIGWHKTAFRFFWRLKSKKRGRAKISPQTISLIKRIHKENQLLSPEKIYERLVELAVTDAPSPNTIAKYIPDVRKSPSDKQRQCWKTFLRNHRKGIWAMDFFIVPTVCFKVLYVFIIVSHDRRKIEHFAVTTNPNSAWVIQQIREATPYGEVPKYLIHDNDSIFTAKVLQEFLLNSHICSKRTGIRCPWQNGICERAIGILRAELLNHVIPLNQKHLEDLLREYVQDYYHVVRTHQGIGCRTPVLSDKPVETLASDTELVSQQILGGLYHGYKKVA